jgi:hypothetical protein
MDGGSSGGCNRIIELREVINNEDNELREKSLQAVLADNPKLKLLIHDLVCKCGFAARMGLRRMLDKFHATNHTNPECLTTFNPHTKVNKQHLKRMRVNNTSVCEQMFRVFNRHRHASTLRRARNRCFWRHFCIFWNAEKKDAKLRMLYVL